MTGNDSGWFKATRGPDPFEVIKSNPYAFVLAYIIAARSRWSDGFNRHGLEMGEAFLGDYTEYGMTERNYRTAKEQLSKWGFATFKTTNKGTIGKLMDSRLFAVITTAADGQNASQPTDSRRTADGQPTTNKEQIRTGEQKEQKKGGPDFPPKSASRKAPREMWQLLADKRQLQEAISKEANSTSVDKIALQSMKTALKQVKKEIREFRHATP